MSDLSDLEKLLGNRSFIRWINGKATHSETKHWNRWLEEDYNHSELLNDARTILEVIGSDQPHRPDIARKLKNFEDALDLLELKIKNKNKYMVPKHPNRSRVYFLVAACVFLFLTVGIYVYLIHKNVSVTPHKTAEILTRQYNTGFGQKKVLKLSDGSKVKMNSNTELTYTKIPDSRSYNFRLKGEAYFSIIHFKGKSKRIIRVYTKDGVIRDLGTKFNVKTNAKNTQAVLIEGNIDVEVSNTQKYKHTNYNIKPNEMTIFSKNNNDVKINNVDANKYISWIYDTWYFSNTPVKKIIEKIEKIYNVKIVLENNKLSNERISGSINNKNLKILEQALSKVLGVKIKQKGKILIIR